ncbi:protein YgfX [Frateuria aurantia]
MLSAPIISFDYRPLRASWRLACLLALVAGMAPWLSGMQSAGGVAVDGLLAGAVVLSGQRRRRQGPLRCIWLGDQRWLLGDDGVAWGLRESWCWGPWVVVVLESGRHRRGLWLGPDNMAAGSLRRLRARLSLTRTDRPIQAHPLS